MTEPSRGIISRVYQEHLGAIRPHSRWPSGNRPIWNRNLDTMQKFYYRPKLVISPEKGEHIEERNRMMRRLGWDITNSGRSRVHGISIGIRIREVGYSTPLLRKASLDSTHNIVARFKLSNIIDPPIFGFAGIDNHPFEEPAELACAQFPDMQLSWGREYEIEFEYACEELGKKIDSFKLEMGTRDNVLLRLTKAPKTT